MKRHPFVTELRSFDGDPTIKEKYLNRVKYHREMGNIIKGYSWKDGTCLVGIAIQFLLKKWQMNYYIY